MTPDNRGGSPPTSYLRNAAVLTSPMAADLYQSLGRGVQHSRNTACVPGCHVSTGTPDASFSASHQWSPTANLLESVSVHRRSPLSEYEIDDKPHNPFSQTKTAERNTQRTRVFNQKDKDCPRHTLTNRSNFMNYHLTRISEFSLPRAPLTNARREPPLAHSIRLCHGEASGEDPDGKLKQPTRARADTELQDSPRTHDTSTAQLTHTDAEGRASMVDVGGKAPTRRMASARATVNLGHAAFSLLRDNQLVKGDALAVAQLAGIMGAKQTATLIPLCHPVPLDHASVRFDLDEGRHAVVITAACHTTGRTGVEMEALMAASLAALALYDMCKAVSHDITITDIQLVSKTGGKRDFHRHPLK